MFSGEVFTNFICFDIDKGKKLAERLIEVLKTKYGLEDNEMLVSFSGSKGYHVDIFFEKPALFKKVKSFYKQVIVDVGCSEQDIEFRPTPGQGVKLPLSYHRKTGKRCILLSTSFLEKDDNYIMEIKKIAWKASWELTEAVEVERYLENLNFELPVDYDSRCTQMLKKNRLLYKGSRHNSTILLLIYLKELGYSEEEAVGRVCEVIKNSSKYISSDMSYALKEVRRLWKWCKGYYMPTGEVQRAVRIYDTDIRAILAAYKKLPERLLLFSLLVHSRRWANKHGVFYMSYKQMAQMGNDQNRARLLKRLETLEKVGVLEIVESRQKERLPNRYKVKIATEKSERYFELGANNSVELYDCLTLLEREELRNYFSKNQYYNLINIIKQS